MHYSQVIQLITNEVSSIDGVLGLYLSGSHGRQSADQYSDLDFVAVVSSDRLEDVATDWELLIGRLFDIVFIRKQLGHSGLINATTSDWMRIDLFMEEVVAFNKRAQDQLVCLFENEPLRSSLVSTSHPNDVSAERLVYLANEFIRVLGLVTIGLGRNERFLCTIGLGHLRSLFINFAVEVEQVGEGGALNLSKVVSPITLGILEGLPTANIEREQIIFAHLETALAFFVYAKPIFKDRELEWPKAFEIATRRHLRFELGCDF